jgi:hypothetical protein
MMIKSISFSERIDPQHGVIISDDFELEKTREMEEETDLIAAYDMLRSNSSMTILLIMTLVLQGQIDKYDDWGGDTCWIQVRNPICELEPDYIKLERKGRVHLEDMIEMMWLRLEIQRKFIEIRKLKENKFLGFKSLI